MPRGDEATDDCGSGSGGSNRSLDAHALLPPPRVATSRVVHGIRTARDQALEVL
ncbi:hypothetical protein ACP70R_019802 [Stipagrostis hirtigluma subsp. patula]